MSSSRFSPQAVNPLLRAAHLAKAGKRVTLMVPWVHPVEQAMIFPNGLSFDTPAEQEKHIRAWLSERAGLPGDSFRLAFYPGRYDIERGSILPLGDITRLFDLDEADICVLEEPEHLTWYHRYVLLTYLLPLTSCQALARWCITVSSLDTSSSPPTAASSMPIFGSHLRSRAPSTSFTRDPPKAGATSYDLGCTVQARGTTLPYTRT